MYDQRRQAEAWRRFITTGVIDEDVVRPEVARSWKRCKAAGVNPWSSSFPVMDENLLREKRSQYTHSLDVNTPIMRMLVALLNCNVSLMDHENFVFGFHSPLSYYPRTFGTYVLEEEVGTGNATIVPYEKKPVRVEGFEQYRAISQTYSGVSAPYVDNRDNYFGALNVNDPFDVLPDYALDMCATAVDLSNELFLAKRGMWAKLATAEFFNPLIRLMGVPVLVTDEAGRILTANEPMRPFIAKYDSYPYASQPLSEYLAKESPLKRVMTEPIDDGGPMRVSFKNGRKKEPRFLELVRRCTVEVGNGITHVVFVFGADRNVQADQRIEAKPRRRSAREVVDYIGESPEWGKVDSLVKKVAPIKANVLLLGETGTGKEVVARALHRLSGRKGPFVAINCGAIPRDLFAAELFGYESGAFTGAKEGGSVGKMEAANGGTLFLDEIGEMPIDLQVGLLRAIQEQQVTRLGSVEPRQIDVRFLAATNQNVQHMIDSGKFRADLYYRLSMVEISLPPLRKRASDIPLLVDFFNRELSKSLMLEYSPFGSDVVDVLSRYTWPGNVRELRNVVERCLIMAGQGDAATVADLPAHIANALSSGEYFEGPAKSMSAAAALVQGRVLPQENTCEDAADERRRLALLLEKCDGDKAQAADLLGMGLDAFEMRLAELGLKVKVVVEMD